MSAILASVVVATYQRPAFLDRCLQALLAQNFPPNAYEVIVVDDGPEDPSTRLLVEEWQQRLQANDAFRIPPILEKIPVTGTAGMGAAERTWTFSSGPAPGMALRYLPARRSQGPAAARNLGWRAAQGEIIAFTDDDTIPAPNWLINGVMVFQAGVAAVSGRVIVPVSGRPTDHERNTAGLERSDFVTANSFYRRSVLEQVGGFDERFQAAWREDADLYLTILEQNLPVAWANQSQVVHPVRPERWGVSLRDQRKSFYNALLYKKHPALYRRHVQHGPPLHYYGMLAGALAAVTGLLLGKPKVAIAGTLLWSGLLARFIHRRLRGASRHPSHVAEMILTSIVLPFLSIYWRVRGALHWKVWFW